MIAGSPFAELASERGAAVLAALAPFDEVHAAAAARTARMMVTPEVAAAALATAFARRRAASSRKFERAASMLFTRDGYEQASSSAVARHRAGRFAGFGLALDLCCGIGSDAIGLADVCSSVIGYDLDADALACAEHNAAALGAGEQVRFVRDDALRVPLAAAAGVFADPSRRGGDRRATSADRYAPPLHALLARAHEIRDGNLCVKVAPGLDVRTVRDMLDGLALEVEVVSERGTCKEATLWCGGLARSDGARRATVIDANGRHTLDGDGRMHARVGPIGPFVGEPDPAVIRSELVGALCETLGAAVLDPRVAYMTTTSGHATPFVRWYRVRDVMPFGAKRVRAYLRERGVGALIVKTRAFPLEPDAIIALLKPRGAERAVLICTTIAGKKTAIVCHSV